MDSCCKPMSPDSVVSKSAWLLLKQVRGVRMSAGNCGMSLRLPGLMHAGLISQLNEKPASTGTVLNTSALNLKKHAGILEMKLMRNTMGAAL